MKKLFLLTIASAASLGMYAQQNSESILLKAHNAPLYKAGPGGTTFGRSTANSANKGTATGGSRWYSSYQLVGDNYTAGAFEGNRFIGIVGWDSTLFQQFSNGYLPVNWIGVANFIDPIFSDGFNSTNFYDPSEIRIRQDNAYTIDSIVFPAAYVKSPTGADTTIDTLFLSVAAVPYDDDVYTKATDSRFKDLDGFEGVTDHNGEMRIQKLATINETRQLNNPVNVQWKFPLPDTLRKERDPSTGTFQTAVYYLEVPGKLNVPAGSGFAISYSFKPGEAWVAADSDSVQTRHYFMFMYANTGQGQQMPYYYYQYHDHSMSYLMHYSRPSKHYASVHYELVNDDFGYEFMYIDGKVTCTSCWDLGINKQNSTIGKFGAFPNPAINDINISYNLNKSTDVDITINNTVGQVIKSHHVSNTTAGIVPFSLTEISNGVYFYTVKSDGESVTRRFVVSH